MTTAFRKWTRNRQVETLGTNSGSKAIAFQGWHHFKEAFSPELIERAVSHNGGLIGSCLDPFAGSGTTALACQFLDIASMSLEVNPFLADLIKAKLTTYDSDRLAGSLGSILRRSRESGKGTEDALALLPKTFVEPGHDGRWLFSREAARELMALREAISKLRNEEDRRLFRVLLGGALVGLSNATVNGKGRRYRRHWLDRQSNPADVRTAFSARAKKAIAEIHHHRQRPRPLHSVQNSDARSTDLAGEHDLAVFSPPYPNSFDYTDVYNIELWMLGYLMTPEDNSHLRQATLTSHVQVNREFAKPPGGCALLDEVLEDLAARQDQLWSNWIPRMVGAYFADLLVVLDRVRASLRMGSSCWIVVGDSRYAGVRVPVGGVLGELAQDSGWTLLKTESFRAMRSSAQQGGRKELAESLLVLAKSD